MSESIEHGKETSIDLHIKITELLMYNFVPVNQDSPTSMNLIRRAVSSIADDIVKLAEDTYGISS